MGAIIIYVGSLVNCEPIWYNPLGEKMGGYCSINTQNLELWWVIPLAFLIGFIIPYITWIIAKIRARIYIPILDD